MFRDSALISQTGAVLQPAPDVPLDALPDRELLALMEGWGRLGKVALRRFMAGLPELARRGLHRRRGCSSIHEYASKIADLSREVVSQILGLHSKIGRYRELWGLLAEGCVGWTKLSRIADFVTPHNVLWWARFVQEAPRHVIERFVSHLKGLVEAEGPAALDPDRLGSCMLMAEEPASPAPDQAAVDGEFGPRSALPDPGLALSSASPPREDSRAYAGSLSSAPTGVAPSPIERPAPRNPGDEPAPGGGSGRGQAALFASPAIGSASSSESREFPEGPGAPEGPEFPPIAGPRRTWIELSPICDALIPRMLAEYSRRGVAVSLSELVEQGLRRLWLDGALDAVPGLSPDPVEDDDHAQKAHELEDFRTTAAPNSAAAPSGPGGATAAAGDRAAEASSAGGASRAAAGDSAAVGSCVSDGPAVERSGSASSRRVPIGDHKILAVVVSVAETGESWMRTLGGVVPVRLADLRGLAPVVQVVRLSDLHRRLSERAPTAKTMPVSGVLFVAAVSGGRCQRQGCNKPAAHVHHLVPRAEGGDHGPGNIVGLCESCHDEKHCGLIANPQDHPADWVGIQLGMRPDSSVVDREYQRIKREAMASGFRVA